MDLKWESFLLFFWVVSCEFSCFSTPTNLRLVIGFRFGTLDAEKRVDKSKEAWKVGSKPNFPNHCEINPRATMGWEWFFCLLFSMNFRGIPKDEKANKSLKKTQASVKTQLTLVRSGTTWAPETTALAGGHQKHWQLVETCETLRGFFVFQAISVPCRFQKIWSMPIGSMYVWHIYLRLVNFYVRSV